MNTRSLRFRMTFWHSVQVAASLLFFGFSVYWGLAQYLDYTMRRSLADQGRAIGDRILSIVSRRGEAHVIRKMNEEYGPATSGRFIRVTRSDGSLFYQSPSPKDGSFDPLQVPPSPQRRNDFFRLAAAANHNKLLIHGLQYTIPEGQTYLIEIGLTDRDIRSTLRGLVLALALGMPLVVSVSMGLSHLLMRKALRPLDEIARQAERITSRNLGERLPLTKTGDEIERLSVSLNRMVCRLEDAFQHSSRFTADVSHELRTPLTILRGQLEEILRQRARRNQMEMIESALEETEQLARIVDHLLEISRLDAGEGRMEKTRLDLSDLVISTAEQMRLLAEEKSITVRYVTSFGVEIEGNASRLGQVVANLLDNAIKYTPEGGSVKLLVAAEESVAVLEITDNGGGIPAEALPHIFERFYRADKARSRALGGVGLGLSIAKAICNAHDANIKVWSDEGDGSCFRVEFPLVNREYELASAVPPRVATEDLGAPIDRRRVGLETRA